MGHLPESIHNDKSCQDPLLGELKISRRAMLALLGGGAAAVMLAACDTNRVVQDGGLPDGRMGAKPIDDGPYVWNNNYTPTNPKNPNIAPPKTLPVIIPRSYWASKGPDLKRIQPMAGVSIITFHHSGDPKPFYADDFATTAQHLENVRHWHRDMQGWQDIGYHFAIDRAGRVWQLRSLMFQGQHVRYHNEHNIGVVVLGNFDLQSPTSAQKERMKWFAKVLMGQYRVATNRVYTHQEIVSTSCPGKAMQPYFSAIRSRAFA